MARQPASLVNDAMTKKQIEEFRIGLSLLSPYVVRGKYKQVVGKSVNAGVLDQVHAGSRQGRQCRGAVDDDNSPQAMWVFSSDAFGTYGLSEIHIAHAGKTQPVGVMVFAGMLLRVQE